jgi:CxxC-x17-CxxC domain-containing protein
MGNFRSDNDRGFGNSSRGSPGRNRFGRKPSQGFGGRFGGRGGFRDRDSRQPLEMFDATCGKCGKKCQVPFKPSGGKPVLCSDCFRKDGGSRSGGFGSRGSSSGISSEQINQINEKLDKILKTLQELEICDEDSDEESEE